ncbi:MAG TPA: hypothetical protein VEU07_13075 [Candidatus Acidoferrum sp.]|nr:hypothetical protein [Candidatus Acidoferrum sp.]
MPKRSFESVEAEIRQEKAEALGRTGERLQQTLVELADLRKELLDLSVAASASPEGATGDILALLRQKVASYTRLREQERQIRQYLVIQREAVGLRRHEDIDRQYPEPSPLALSMINPNGVKESS